MRPVNASSWNFAAKLESFTPMARLAQQTSGLYVCSFHFLQIRFSTLLLKFIYLQFAPCILSKVFLILCLIACGFNECWEGSSVPRVPRLLSAFRLLTAFFWSFTRHWISSFLTIAPFGQPACWVFFGFLRAAEFTVPNLASFSPAIHLSVADISVDSRQSPTCLRVRIKASKTDPFRQGCHIHIGLGRAPLCAVHALMAYLSLRGKAPGPLFLLASGQPLSRALLTDWLRQIFSTAGIEGNFSSHSFRIGAATVAARNGIPDHLIQALGRWTSNAYQLYIRTPSEALAGFSGQLVWHRVSLPLVLHSSLYVAVEFSTKLLGACTAVFWVLLLRSAAFNW